MRWIDAHNHLQDPRLAPFRAEVVSTLEQEGVTAVVNGTREEDWESVAALASAHPWVRPACGLHPWYVAGRSPEWLDRLRGVLDRFPQGSIGEIGLDRWQKDHDFPAQREVFAAQLALARERELPVTVHCLEAWGALEEMTRGKMFVERGWLLHSYGGSAEMAEVFARRGAYFSFSGYFLHERKAAQREVFRKLPLERLLVETDAPDMLPPEGEGVHFLRQEGSAAVCNSPGNIGLCYEGLAKIRGMPMEELAQIVEGNFRRLFS